MRLRGLSGRKHARGVTMSTAVSSRRNVGGGATPRVQHGVLELPQEAVLFLVSTPQHSPTDVNALAGRNPAVCGFLTREYRADLV